MRRNILHVSLALFTFAGGYLASDNIQGIVLALIFATVLFTLVKFFLQHESGRHYLTIAVLTLVIWIPFALLALQFGDHMTLSTSDFSFTQPTQRDRFSRAAYGRCRGDVIDLSERNTIWAGVLDGRTVYKPSQRKDEPSETGGVVAVSVLVDQSGRPIWAEAISGPVELRETATALACRAGFPAAMFERSPLKISGILTYHFRAKMLRA